VKMIIHLVPQLRKCDATPLCHMISQHPLDNFTLTEHKEIEKTG